ncbi:MAG: hypothetical protein GKS02_02265 [Alphaproteobacteria bacterium]|nr:hypothetical protein [Alphaproteobacteria bacterium]
MMRQYFRARSTVFGALALFVLAACSSADDEALAPQCPHIVIVKDTSELTAFRPGPGRDLTDVVLDARIDRFEGECVTDLESSRPVKVNVDLQMIFEATRGPASETRTGEFSFFVAIANRSGDILAKRVFDTEFEFEGNRNRIGGIEELTQEIPLRRGERGEDFDIFIGFQLDPEQLKYNQAKNVR